MKPREIFNGDERPTLRGKRWPLRGGRQRSPGRIADRATASLVRKLSLLLALDVQRPLRKGNFGCAMAIGAHPSGPGMERGRHARFRESHEALWEV